MEIKQDISDFIKTEKRYLEQELIRLVNNDFLYSHEHRIKRISKTLGDIAISNTKLLLLDAYFKVEEIEEENKLTEKPQKKQKND